MVKKKYLIDTNVLATPYRSYYPFDFAPLFLEQMVPLIQNGTIVIFDKVYEELTKGTDELTEWLLQVAKDKIMTSKEEKILLQYQDILTYIQDSSNYTDQALRSWSSLETADPWLIAAAKVHNYDIVTFETSAGKITNPSRNPKIPDVAKVSK